MACPTRRCSVCRKTFRPDRRAEKTQQVCSSVCRVERRRAQAGTRRASDLEGYRAAESARQAAWRAARGARPKPVSRAESASEVREVIAQIVKRLAKVAVLSRAGFERDVSKIIKESVEKLAKACA